MFEFTTDMAVLQDESTPAVLRRSGDSLQVKSEARRREGRTTQTVIQVVFLDAEGVEQTAITRTTVTPGSYSRSAAAYQTFYGSLGLTLLSVQFMAEHTYLMAGVRQKADLTLIRGGLTSVDIRL